MNITPEFLCETEVARPGQVVGEVKGLMVILSEGNCCHMGVGGD